VKTKRGILIFLAIAFLVASCATMNIGDVPWQVDIKQWQPKQRADFMMNLWMSEKSTYDRMNAIENKPPDLITVLKAKYQVLEQSRKPMRAYAQYVNSGGIPNPDAEQELINWLRELQLQFVYGGG
jgi:hypothetical protein